MTCLSCSGRFTYSRARVKIPRNGGMPPWECSLAAGVQMSGLRCRIAGSGHQENYMSKFAIRLLTLALLSLTLVAAPVVTVVYANPDNDAPPPPDKGKKKKS